MVHRIEEQILGLRGEILLTVGQRRAARLSAFPPISAFAPGVIRG
jgi:hypothetical protein